MDNTNIEKTRLENCAAWHMTQVERAERRNDRIKVAHHDAMAFRLFAQARELASSPAAPGTKKGDR